MRARRKSSASTRRPAPSKSNPAMTAALRAYESWSRTSTDERVSLLLGAAAIIRERKFEFMAWLTYEVGKNWAEADADVGETIDFLEFYAREALRLAAATTPIQYPGERNELLYIPLGVGAVILALELSLRHHGRHDRRRHRHWQHRDSETLVRFSNHRRQVC
ncbi:MAG: aldehyde dehydrogenase family protein [Terracidiphilus sp.]